MTAADLILTGARVRTLDPARPTATAVALRDGTISAVGTADDARDWRGPGTEVVDLHGAHLVPGLTDAHSHPVWGLDMATGTDLSGVTDLAGLRAALARAERVDGWVVGYGLDHNAFEGRPIHHELVADVLADTPAFLRLYDGHSALVNGAALAAAGVTGPRAFDQRAQVVCDASGRPTGHLVEHAAMDLVTSVVPRPSHAERRARLLELLSGMAATGLTGAHVMDGGDPDLVGAVARETVLPVRLRFAPWCMPGADADALRELIEAQGRGGRHWVVGGVKFFMDGTVEGGTAWLDHPDCHGQGTDAFWPDPHAYAEAVRTLHAAGV
ncbi:amidohydrolase, partial [Streptomyces tricolor]